MKTNIKDLDLPLLLALDALLEERSVTRAAERLSLTQPTVSGMLKRLRDLFGDELFVRSAHGVIPTPRAEALAAPVREILDATRALLMQPEFDPATARFDVRLCGTDYVHNTLFGPLVGNILRQAPGARVALLHHHGSTEQAIARGEIDMVFSSRDLAAPTVPGLPLYRSRLVCLSSYAAHAEGEVILAPELCALNHVILTPFGAPISKRINDWLQARGLARNIVVQVPNFAGVFQAMRHAELVAFVPEQMADLQGQGIKRLRTDVETPTYEMVANWHPRMTNDPRHAWLRGVLSETAAFMSAAGR